MLAKINRVIANNQTLFSLRNGIFCACTFVGLSSIARYTNARNTHFTYAFADPIVYECKYNKKLIKNTGDAIYR